MEVMNGLIRKTLTVEIKDISFRFADDSEYISTRTAYHIRSDEKVVNEDITNTLLDILDEVHDSYSMLYDEAIKLHFNYDEESFSDSDKEEMINRANELLNTPEDKGVILELEFDGFRVEGAAIKPNVDVFVSDRIKDAGVDVSPVVKKVEEGLLDYILK